MATDTAIWAIMAAAVIITDGVADAAITTAGTVTAIIIAAGESIAQKPLPGGFLRISYMR